MKSKTKISNQAKRKFNPELVETIKLCKKKENSLKIASILSQPRRQRVNLNLREINEKSKEGEKVLIPGKVLSQGELDKKIKIVAFNFSEKAREKLLNSKCDIKTILEEIKSNPEMKDIKIIR